MHLRLHTALLPHPLPLPALLCAYCSVPQALEATCVRDQLHVGRSQGTTGPRMLSGLPSRGQQPLGGGNVMNAAQTQGLKSDALRMSTLCGGCPEQPVGQLGSSGLALRDL